MSNVNDSANSDPLDHNTKWCNIPITQVFQFDHQPVNVIQVGTSRNSGVGADGVTSNGQYNNLYQLTRRLQNKQLKGWQSWMNWVQKIQPDYKFLTVLQRNAQTCIFANVDDPWMFTQYIFKGIGKYYDPAIYQKQGTCAVKSDYAVIEPALYKWDTLQPLNAQAYQRKAAQTGDKESQWASESKYFNIISKDGYYKKQFGNKYIRRYTTGADGAYIYKVQIDVQCVKWGQHGNIPPHVIDMHAPAKYMQSATKLTLKTMRKPVLGVPLYHDNGGLFRKIGDKLYIDTISNSVVYNQQVVDDNGNKKRLQTQRITIHQGDEPIYKPTTNADDKFSTKLRLVSTQRQNGQLLVNGCKYYKILKGIPVSNQDQELDQDQEYVQEPEQDQESDNDKWYVCGCSLDSDFSQQQRNRAVCSSRCTDTNTQCPFYTKAFNINSPRVIVARFQAYQRRFYDDNFKLKQQETQLRNLAMVTMTTGGVVGALAGSIMLNEAMAYNQKNKSKDGYSGQITYQTVYEMQQTPLNGIVVNIPPNAQNYKGATVQRGTGQSAFDLPAIKQRIIYQNDTSPINYTRWMSNIMPCYDKKYCNSEIGANFSQKIHFPCNCGVDYKTYGNHNQVITKNTGFCPYYKTSDKKNIGCPYNSINKNAMDFAMHNKFMNQNLFQSIALPIAERFASGNGIESNNGNSKRVYETKQIYAIQGQGQQQNTIITIYYKDVYNNEGKEIRNFPNNDVAVIQLSKTYGIQQQVLNAYHKNNLWQLCKVKYVSSNGSIKTFNGQTQCWAYAKYWPYVMDEYSNGSNNAKRLQKKTPSGALQDVQWCFQIDHGQIPKKDPLFVDNQQKFIGGYHPQYLQYPASPQQILYKKQQQYDTYDIIQTKADASQFGQVARVGSKQVQYGYFIMQTGNWILDGRSIGEADSDGIVQFPSVDDLVGAENQRAKSPAQSFKGGVAIHNVWQNTFIDPQAEKPITKQIKNCVIFANDTADSIKQLKAKPPKIQAQDSDKQIDVPPKVCYPQYLPRQRSGCYCANCKTVLALRFLKYQGYNSQNLCPWCRKKLVLQKPLQYFPRTKAMGRVSVWGLPGTIIKTDSYFWKSQAKVNNALIDQMTFKLGIPNIFGGGYQQNSSNSFSQKIDRVGYNVANEVFVHQKGRYAMGMPSDLYQYITGSSLSSTSNATIFDNLVMVNPNQPINVLNLSSEGQKKSQNLTDNRIINPFTEDFKGLKMVTSDYMVQIRNRLQPTLAYTVGKKPNQNSLTTGLPLDSFYFKDNGISPSKPSEYQQYRVQFGDRKHLSFYKKWVKRRNVVNNVVVAYAGDADHQAQAFVQFPVGESEQWYWAKKYYPPDPHWWYDRQIIGGIATTLSGNQCHIDISEKRYPGYRWNAYKNIQSSLYSSVYLCMHGYVPLDKMVVAAYLVQPGRQISCDEDPVGEFQIIGSYANRVAYNHYHSFYKGYDHQKGVPGFAISNYVDSDSEFPYGNCHVHHDSGNFTKGDQYSFNAGPNYENVTPDKVKSNSNKYYVDKYGDLFFIDQKSGIPIYKRKYFQKNKDHFLTKTQDVHLNQWHQQNLPYYTMLKKVNMDNVLSNLAHSVDTHIGDKNSGYGLIETNCIKWDGFGTDIVQTKTQNEIWKQFTTQEFQKYQQQYRAQIQYKVDFGDGDVQTKQFVQYYSKFNDFVNEQMQAIPGYFPTDGINTSGLLNIQQNKVKVDTKDIQGQYGDFIVTQAQQNSNNGNQSNYADQYVQAGQSDKVLDITSSFTTIYNQRISVTYTATTSQKTVSDFCSNLESSKWEGVSSNPNANDMKHYNQRKYYKNGGYILNTNDWMPKLDDQRLLNAVQYEKIQIDKHIIYYSQQCNRTYSFQGGQQINIKITNKNTKNTTTKNINIGDSGSSESSSTLTTSAIVNILNKNDIPATLLGDNIVMQTDGEIEYDIKIGKAITFLKTPLKSNRLVSYTNYYGKYHPYNLINPDSKDPWITISDKFQIQTCVIDLYHVPRQQSRRDYRVERGYTDYSNAYCKNDNCKLKFKYNGKLNVSSAARNQGISFNKSSSVCPWCGQQLSGGDKVDSDGISTYIYDQPFEQDQIIKTIQFQMLTKDQTGFAVDNKINAVSLFVSDDLQKWQCIFTAIPVEADVYHYTVNKKYQDDELFQNQKHNANETYTFEIGQKKLIRGRYLKVAIQPSIAYLNYAYFIQSYNNGCIKLGGQTSDTSLIDANKYSIDNIPNGYLNGCSCKVYIRDQQNKIGRLDLLIKDNIGTNIYVDQTIVNRFINNKCTLFKIQFQAKLYRTCLSKINVIGCSYIASKLIITPKQTVESRPYNSSIDLGYLPIRFDKVSVIINDCYQIILQQIMKYSDINNLLKYHVQVVSETYCVQKRDDQGKYILDENKKIQYQNKPIKYYKITGGRFYFDVGRKKIILPRYCYAKQYITQLEFGKAGSSTQQTPTKQEDLKTVKKEGEQYVLKMDQLTDNLSKWGIYKSSKPTQIHTVIWSGQQGGVNLQIIADGVGPAYQVERGSICFIKTQKYLGGGKKWTQESGEEWSEKFGYYNGKSTPLPNPSRAYKSYQEINNNTVVQEKIPWIVYNNELVTKKDSDIQQLQGQFYVPTSPTMRTDKSKQFFEKNIVGVNCKRASGRCYGQITLKGKPNTVISGELKVYAAPITRRCFHDNVYGYQLTGGLKQGGMLISPELKLPAAYKNNILNKPTQSSEQEKEQYQKNGGYRAALAYDIPYILVYLKQYSPFQFGANQPGDWDGGVETIEYCK